MRTDQGKECSNKECERHGQILPFTEFSVNRSNPDGYEYRCKQCKAKATAALRERKKEGGNAGGKGQKKRQYRHQGPGLVTRPSPINGLDAQLAVDLKQMKQRIAKEVLQIYQAGGERAVEEAFA